MEYCILHTQYQFSFPFPCRLRCEAGEIEKMRDEEIIRKKHHGRVDLAGSVASSKAAVFEDPDLPGALGH